MSMKTWAESTLISSTGKRSASAMAAAVLPDAVGPMIRMAGGRGEFMAANAITQASRGAASLRNQQIALRFFEDVAGDAAEQDVLGQALAVFTNHDQVAVELLLALHDALRRVAGDDFQPDSAGVGRGALLQGLERLPGLGDGGRLVARDDRFVDAGVAQLAFEGQGGDMEQDQGGTGGDGLRRGNGALRGGGEIDRDEQRLVGFVCCLLDDEHRQFAVAEQALGSRAEEQVAHEAAAVRPENQQIGRQLGRTTGNFLDQRAVGDLAAGRDAVVLVQRGGQLLQFVAAGIDQALLDFCRQFAEQVAQLFHRRWRGHVNQVEHGAELAGEQGGTFRRMAGRRRKIGGGENVFQGSHGCSPVGQVYSVTSGGKRCRICRLMPAATSSSPRNTVPIPPRRNSSDTSSIWVRRTISMLGLSVRAQSAICRMWMASGMATTSIAAWAMCAWISTAGSAALPETAAQPWRRRLSTCSRFCSTTTYGMPRAFMLLAMRWPTRP